MDLQRKKNIGPRFGVRHIQCVLLFTLVFVMYTILSNIPLAIVAMTDSSKANPDFEQFDWNEEKRATILSSFFWGYVLSQIPCAALVTRFGAKAVLLIGVGINCFLNLIIPQCTSLGGYGALLALRILQGVFQGVLFPATHGLIARWAPIHERSRLSIWIYPGAQIGTIVSLMTGGPVASSSVGWPGIFYIWGSFGLIWCVAWWWFGANSPNEHPSISLAELEYILESTPGSATKQPTPWRKIMVSGAFYTLLLTHICNAYTYWTITTITPTYLNGLFGMNIRENAILSAIPSVGFFLLSHLFGLLSRFCISKLNFTLRMLRLTFNSIGLLIPAASLVGLGFVTSDYPGLAVALLTISYGAGSAVFMGFYVNHMDLCPSHAAILMGVTNSISTGGGILSTLAVGWLVKDETNNSQWQILFSIGAGLLILGTFIFGLFGRFENQNWISEEAVKVAKNDEYPSGSLETIKSNLS